MSSQFIDEFDELLPHVLLAQTTSGRDNYGRLVSNGTVLYYHCLIQDQEMFSRTAEGTTITTSLTAYINPYGYTQADPLTEVLKPITKTDHVYIATPSGFEGRPIAGVASYYDETGVIQTQVVRFT